MTVLGLVVPTDKNKNRFHGNQFVYTNDNHKTFFTPKPARFEIANSSVCTRVFIFTEEPVSGAEIRTVVTIPAHEKRIDFDNELLHVRDLKNDNRYYRYGYYAFPFAVENAKRNAEVNGVTDAQIRIYDGEDDVTDEYFVNDGKIVKAVTASFTLGEHIASVSYTTTDQNVESGEATADFALKVLPGTVVTLEVACEAGCHYEGETTWMANADLSVDLKVTSFDSVEVISADGATTNIYTSLQVALNNVGKVGASETNTVRLLRNVEGDVIVGGGKAAILDLNGWTLTGSGSDSVIRIASNAALTLTDTSDSQTGKVTMPEDEAGPLYGGGVYNAGTFTMTGGTITDCKATNSGGGVYNYFNSTFTMSGGTIANCTARFFGGGVCNYGTFTMTGGAVKDAISVGENCSISGGLFGKPIDDSWLAEGAAVEDNLDPATKDEYPPVVRGGGNCVVMVRTEGLESLVVSNGTEAVAGYPAAGYRIFEVAKGAELAFAYEAA